MSYQKYKETIKLTNEARRAAVRVLINQHREEFNELYFTEATKCGLNPTKIAAQIEKTRVQAVAAATLEQEVM
jgi:hypothetical protein